ncbi:MAG: hypothetical protein QOF31_4358 [Mycobacterium sp.]|nr:hypothetical protein [Mycobacterium sp.]
MITAILDHRTGLDLVGVKVYSETKHGRDVGTLVGRDPIGVLATADTAEIVAMRADCCLEAATWAPSGANAQAWRFVVLRSPEQRAVVAKAAAHALEVIEPVYGMTRPAEDDHSARARNNRTTYELHDRAGEFTSALFSQERFPTASELLLGGCCAARWASPTTGRSRATSWWGGRRAGTGPCAAAHLPRR